MHSSEGLPGLPPFPDDMPEDMRQCLREAHENGDLGKLLLAALQHVMDPDEQLRQNVRRVLDANPDDIPTMTQKFGVTSGVRADGSEILFSFVRLSENEQEAKVEARDFLQKIVRPVLVPGEKAMFRVVELTFWQMIEHASETYTLPEFEEHVLLMQVDSEHEARVAKYEACQECETEDCKDRVTEPPTRDDEPPE